MSGRPGDLTPPAPLSGAERGEQGANIERSHPELLTRETPVAAHLPLSAPEMRSAKPIFAPRSGLGGEVTPAASPGQFFSTVRFGWAVTVGALRDFVWADLRDGVLDLRGLGSPLRALVWLGFGLLLLVIAAILQGDLWRQAFPLVPLTQGIPGRGRLVPVSVIPVTFFLLSLSWAFVLAGALRSHWVIRLLVIGMWMLTMAGSMVSGGVGGALSYAVAVLTLLAVPVACLIFTFRAPRRVLELLVLLALVSANNAVNQLQGVATWQISGMPLMVLRLSFEMATLSMVIMPLLLLVGMDVASFSAKAAFWVTGIAQERLARWAPAALLGVLLLWRTYEVSGDVSGWLDTGPLDVQLTALAGGLLVPLLVGVATFLVWRLLPRRIELPDRDQLEEDAKRLAFPIVLSYTAGIVIVVVLSGFALALTVLGLFVPDAVPLSEALLWATGVVGNGDVQLYWHIVVSLIALGVAAVLARRGYLAGALYLAILGLHDLRGRLASDGWPLEFIAAAGPGNRSDLWWLLLLTGLTVYWLARRQLTPERASVLAFVVLTTLLLRQTDFISNRFSPFVIGGGLGFLAFGIVWDALTIGAWANTGTPALPRVSRILLYLGYILMTVTVINWFVASHDLAAVGRLTGDLGLVGLEAFGKPLLFTMFVVALMGAFRGEGITAMEEDEGTDDPAGGARQLKHSSHVGARGAD